MKSARLRMKLGRFSASRLARNDVRLRLDRPVVSITFDDFPRSALEIGGRILENEGVAGTFYCAFGLAGTRTPSGRVGQLADLADCAGRGHEISCHTYSHLDCAKAAPERIDDDIRRNQAVARDLGLPPFRHFAYPFGSYSLAAKKTVMRHYASARGTVRGVNKGVVDLGLLKSVPLYSRVGDRKLEPYFRELSSDAGWLIFYTHDVSRNPSPYGCRAEEMECVIRRAKEVGAKISPIGAVIDELLAPAIQ